MWNEKFNEIIVRFLHKEADGNDLKILDECLKSKRKISKFNAFVRIDYLTSLYMLDDNLENVKKSIWKKVKKANYRRKVQLYGKLAVAATISIIIGLSVLLKDDNERSIDAPIVIQNSINKTILTMEDGNEIELEKGQSYEDGLVSSNGEHLIYSKNIIENKTKPKVSYNSLTVPRGGEFFLQLSDGTKVWLNSESKIKYPISFVSGLPRKIELLYGEAYLEVSPSNEHLGSSFEVLTGTQFIKVLGTEFNIKAYKNANEIITTLVGGKIEVRKGGITKELSPNQQSKIEYGKDDISISYADVSTEIAWVRGIFNFEKKSLSEIMEILSRWYDVDVFFESSKSKDFIFSGILERTKSIEDILKVIQTTSEGEIAFEIKDKVVIIK